MNSIALFIFAVLVIGPAASLRSVCYHTNWSQYRRGDGKFFPDDIDPSYCTHIIYAFAKLNGQNHLTAFEWNDESEPWAKGLYEKFNDLKQKRPGLKTLIAVGGWNMGSGPFTKMAATSASRLDFAKDTVKFLRDRHFDGLDVDWEYPAGRGSPPTDKAKYIDLLAKLREAFDAEARASGSEPLLLSAAVPAGKDNIDNGFDIPAVSKSLDLINLMTYDLHGSWETFTGHNSPLYARSDETGDQRHLNLDWAASYWVQKGAPKHKMNIGMGLYGRSFTLSSSNTAPGAPAKGPGHPGEMTKEGGFISYYEICKIERSGGVVHRIQDQMVPYVVQGDQWIGYDDPQSLTTKVNYVKQHGYGGVMVWALPLDDFKGTCGQGTYPLMKAINAAMGGTSQHIVAPVTPHMTDQPMTAPTKHPVNGHTTQAAIVQTNDFSCIHKGTGFYANPSTCSSYYVCVAGVSYPINCRDGLYYNTQTQVCDFEYNVQCTSDDHQHKPATTSAPAIQTVAPHTDHHTDPVNFCATKANGLYKDPATCTMFYNCAHHATYHQPCAPGTGFDDTRKLCDIPSHLSGCH